MCKRGLDSIGRAGIIILLTVALVATAFAHRFPSLSDPMIEAYILAGGELGDLCSEPGSDGETSHHDCPACHIIGSLMLSNAWTSVTKVDYVFASIRTAPRESRAIRSVLDPARGLRAPPLA